MKVIEVKGPSDWTLFHRAAAEVYRNDPNWIEPLHKDIEGVFDPARNKAMERGEAQLYVLLDNRSRPIGRVAAFIDPVRNEEMNLHAGGIGFFECINDQEAADLLLDRAEVFLSEKGMQVIDAIINFGERDKFWGLLAKGFFPPLYQENYNPPYYRLFFEKRGYRTYEQILTLKGALTDLPHKRLGLIAERARKRYGFRSKTLKESNMRTFAGHFAEIYNVAFSHNPYFNPISEENMYKLFKQVRPVADPQMVCITYKGDQPVGFAGFLPDINPFLRKAKGKLNWFTLPGFFLRLKTSRKKMLKGIAFGIHPKYQGKGVFAVLVDSTYHQSSMPNYPYYYLATIRAHNAVMVRSVKSLGVQVERIHLSMRKTLDNSIPFSAYPFFEPDL